jgi:hypothetical protein
MKEKEKLIGEKRKGICQFYYSILFDTLRFAACCGE